MELKKLLKIFEATQSGTLYGFKPPENALKPGSTSPAQSVGISTTGVGTGASGFPVRSGIGQPKSRTAKPIVNPNQAAVDAANRTRNAQMAVLRGEQPTDRFAAATSGSASADVSADDNTAVPATAGAAAMASRSSGKTVDADEYMADLPAHSGKDTPAAAMQPDSLSELKHLSGIEEVAPPTAKHERMVKHIKKGYGKKGKLSDKEKSIAYATAWKDYNKSNEGISESIMLETGTALEHLIDRFRHETKNFINGAELDEELYNALYDYYAANGEMPYVVQKAKHGEDPYSWVSRHFEDSLAMMGYPRQFQETVMPVVDNSLSELARLAGLSEGRVDECGDMGMGGEESSMNVSTNMSSDGKKSVTISAQGEEAEALMQMLKLAGMGHHGHDSHSDEPVVMISGDDEIMDEEYANSPEEEYETVAAITRQGNDLNREKRQYADKPKLGDNPMAESLALDEEFESMLESILIRDDKEIAPNPKTGRVSVTYPPPKSNAPDQSELPLPPESPESRVSGPRSATIKLDKTKEVDEDGGMGGVAAEQPYRDEKTGKMVYPPRGATMPPPDSEFPPGDPRNMMPPKAPKAPQSSAMSKPGIKK